MVKGDAVGLSRTRILWLGVLLQSEKRSSKADDAEPTMTHRLRSAQPEDQRSLLRNSTHHVRRRFVNQLARPIRLALISSEAPS